MYSETAFILLNAETCKIRSLARTNQSEPTVAFTIALLHQLSTNGPRRHKIKEVLL